jgi:branched-subunit amino acid ABC-type transport system permease component
VTQFLSYAIPGLPYGCVFALMAVGLVLTYQTSGVFNLAYGAQAYASALIFYVCVNAGWPSWAGFLAAVVVAAPLLGLAMDRFLYRFIRSAPVLVKLVSALGMLIAIPSALQLIFGSQERLAPPSLWLPPDSVYFHVAGDAINGTELSTVIVTLAVVLLASLMSHFTQIGLRMRAMAESPRMVQLAGINSERVGVAIWVLSSFLAGLAGVLLAPLFAELQALNFTDLLVAAIAAAALGSLTSLPLAFWGGIGLGVVQELLGGYLPSGSVLSSGLRPALPFAVLIVLLLALPGLRERWFHDDPLSACDPPPPPMAAAIGGHGLEELLRGGGWAVLAVFFVSCLTWVPGNWTFTLTQGLAYSIIFLSIVLLTGMSGQISLCQAAFAGIGAFTCAQLVSHFGISVFVGIVAGGAVAAVVGVVVAMPALRLGGLALALATLAFGLLADNVGFQFPWSGNGDSGVNIPRPQLGSLNFTSGKAFFVLAFVLLIACAAVVLAIRQGTTGRELAAMRGSELAAASIGTNLAKLKITVFAVAAALAGVGGALYGSLQGTVSPNDFNSFLSLVFMVVVVTTGVYTVQGAIQAGMAYVILYQVLDYLPSEWRNLFPILFGLGAVTYALHPEGVVEWQKRRVVEIVVGWCKHPEAVG